MEKDVFILMTQLALMKEKSIELEEQPMSSFNLCYITKLEEKICRVNYLL